MMNPWQKVAHALTYVSGPNVYEWKRSAENWILSIPAPSALNKTIYEDFEEEFVESWTDTNESYRPAAALDKLRMKDEEIDEYITTFAELARTALYHEDDPAVLEKFKSGLPLKLLEPCMHHDDPRSWEAWTRSARTRQAILTSLKAHQACYDYDLHSFYRPNADRTDCRSRRGPIPEPAERKADRIPNPLDRD